MRRQAVLRLVAGLQTTSSCGTASSIPTALFSQSSRWLSSAASTEGADAVPAASPKIRKLADAIMGLTVLEASRLSEILRKDLNMEKPAFGGMPMPMMMPGMPAAGAAAAPAAGAGAAAEPEPAKEKTAFDVKLESFSAEGKIKVIKEIRALTSLGLKEAKELVEKAPVVVKAGVSKADAEAMQKQLEAVGAKVVLD